MKIILRSTSDRVVMAARAQRFPPQGGADRPGGAAASSLPQDSVEMVTYDFGLHRRRTGKSVDAGGTETDKDRVCTL